MQSAFLSQDAKRKHGGLHLKPTEMRGPAPKKQPKTNSPKKKAGNELQKIR